MATEILAAGTTAASSEPFTLADGESATLILRVSGSVPLLWPGVSIEVQDSANGWNAIGSLQGSDDVKVLQATGTFRVTRRAGPNVGVDRA